MQGETIRAATEIFEKILTAPPSENPRELYNDHVKIRQVLDQISSEQDKFEHDTDRYSKLPAFLDWVKRANIKMDGVDLVKSDKGFSMIAKEDLKRDSFAVEVPRSAIMTADSNKINKGLRELFLTDQLVQSVENCPIVLLLAHEMLDPKSSWKPYLDILPADVGGPLTMSLEELQSMKPSPAFVLALQFFRCIARHFVYFLLIINARETSRPLGKASNEAIRKTLFTTKNFSFDLYAWCTSIVTSRVNRIPNLIQIGQKTAISPALVPIMDFANFEFVGDAKLSQSEVFYAIPQKKVQLLLHRDIGKGDEVVIPCGNKTNMDCLLYSGFVPSEENPVNVYELKLGFPRTTDLWKIIYAQKMGILTPKEMATTFIIHLSTFYSHQLEYVAFWNFAKLFVANQSSDFNTKENVIKSRDYVLKRFSLYLEGYKDLPTSESKNASCNAKYIWRMKFSEKRILEAMVNYFQQPIEKIIESNGPVYDVEETPLDKAIDAEKESQSAVADPVAANTQV